MPHITGIRWRVFYALAILHIGALCAFFFISKSAIFAGMVLWLLTGLVGITVGYHRLFSHRSFETYKIVEYFHLLCAALAMQQGPISWVRIHRAHHRYSDTNRDPHPQHLGYIFGHGGWAFIVTSDLDLHGASNIAPSDLRKDKAILFFERFHFTLFFLSFVILYIIGGIEWLLWAGFFRVVFVMHITWAINSITHRFGYRNYQTNDKSKNFWPLAILAFGEGWHNNHHRFPNSARQGLRYWEFDLSWYWIKMLELLGLAWNIKLPIED